jgi:glucokinase
MPHHVYGAVDIGGTKIAAGLVDTEGELLHRVVLPTPARGSAQEVFATVAKLIDALAEDPRWARVAGVGIGSAGPVDPRRGTVSPVNIPGWREFPLVAQVSALPAVAEPGAAAPQGRAVTLIGDASAMAAGEHWRGAARGHDDVLCLVVSTGVGAGLIMDGALRTGPSGNAGHLGHITVDFEGEPCPCGSFGCVETMSSGTSIARWAVANGWRPEPLPAPGSAAAPSANGRGDNVVNSMRAEAAAAEGAANGIATIDRAKTSSNTPATATALAGTGAPASASAVAGTATAPATAATATALAAAVPAPAIVTAVDVAASALLGNEIALAAFDRAGRALAAGIAAAATLADLRVAVVGGGVAKAGPLLFDPLRRHLERYASLPFTRGMVVLPATLGGDAGLIGAAAALAAALPPDARQR